MPKARPGSPGIAFDMKISKQILGQRLAAVLPDDVEEVLNAIRMKVDTVENTIGSIEKSLEKANKEFLDVGRAIDAAEKMLRVRLAPTK